MRLSRLKTLALILAMATLTTACGVIPITGRRALNLVPASQLHSMSFSQYSEFLAENPPSAKRDEAAMVQRVGQRIQTAVERYFAERQMSDRLAGYAWEFKLIDDPQVNAWCMPGGKVAVFTGILAVARDETGLAVVMGHEIAHAVANHGGERMSQEMVVKMGSDALSKRLEEKSPLTQQIFLGAFGAGSKVGVLLPFSRLHESEADHLGLVFMAMAGYDPRQAADFWTRMSAQSQGAPMEFLSTHPSDETRVQKLQELTPEAMQHYKK